MKKSLFTLIIFVAAFSLAALFQISKTQAGPGNNVSGWLWSGSDDGAGNSTGLGWISLNNTNTGAVTNFGVNIPMADGDLTGNVWSSNIGWISFDAGNLSLCPSGTCSARRAGNALQGWARILSIRDALAAGNSGGWEGWIKLSGSGYGVSINPATGSLSGYASSNELGWIDFSRASMTAAPTNPQLIVCPATLSVTVGTPGYLQARYWNDFVSGTANCGSVGYSDVTAAAAWSSNFPATATVVLGTVNGGAAGSANITATYSGLSAVVPVTVTAAAADQIKICATCTAASSRLGSLFLTQGTTYNAKACRVVSTEPTCLGVDVASSATWSPSSNPVASVNSTGVITGNSVGGPVAITASSGGLSDTLDVTVLPAACPPDPSCAADTCIGLTCDGGCPGNSFDGTKTCSGSGSWKEVAP